MTQDKEFKDPRPLPKEKEVALPKCSRCKKIPLICKCQEFEDLNK